MGRGHDLRQVKPGYRADLLLVDADPLTDIMWLQRPEALLMIMKDSALHQVGT